MGTMTLAIPNELQARMKQFPEMKWSEVARKAISARLAELEHMEDVLSKSTLTKKDVEAFSKKMKHLATERFNREHRR